MNKIIRDGHTATGCIPNGRFPNMEFQVGDQIRIIRMMGEPHYDGRTGTIVHIDDAGQLHGTWGSCAIIPEEDDVEILSNGGRK